MPEITGTVTDLIKNPRKNNEVFGLNIDGTEYLYSFPDKRGEPFEEGSRVGDMVRIEYSPFTDSKGKEKQYISVLELITDGGEAPVPYDDERSAPYGEPGTQAWGYHQKDILMFIESCAKGACAIYAAALTGGQLKEMPKGDEVTSLARVLENHGTERFKALMEELD